MKWLFATLMALNLIVFAGMIASKMLKQYVPIAPSVQQQQPVVINVGQHDDVAAKSASEAIRSASRIVNPNTTSSSVNTRQETRNHNSTRQEARSTQNTKPATDNRRTVITNADIPSSNTNSTVKAKYKECSARVSLPEDDYHRIKGLLGRYPHAASRQVVDNGNGESSARMNVVFMQVSDQEASAIQGIVGRYGQLNRAACNR